MAIIYTLHLELKWCFSFNPNKYKLFTVYILIKILK